jgi:hypothetical protein
MFKHIVKQILKRRGIDRRKDLHRHIAFWSLKKAQKQQHLGVIVEQIRNIVPDISDQESRINPRFDQFWELKRRNIHGFQCKLMLDALKSHEAGQFMVVDIGDSSGSHMLYLHEMTRSRFDIETLSVNLDHRAIIKIKNRGLKALLKRAEDIQPEDVGGKPIELVTSFQMVEHLHNPAIFFRRLAREMNCNRLLITVPYVKESRVGLHHVRKGLSRKVYAEDEHIFELSPKDWRLLLLHSGWQVASSSIYFQYPRGIPVLSRFLRNYWKQIDFEGFWGAILNKDETFSSLYQDWEN